jgi:hypothetical protein
MLDPKRKPLFWFEVIDPEILSLYFEVTNEALDPEGEPLSCFES